MLSCLVNVGLLRPSSVLSTTLILQLFFLQYELLFLLMTQCCTLEGACMCIAASIPFSVIYSSHFIISSISTLRVSLSKQRKSLPLLSNTVWVRVWRTQSSQRLSERVRRENPRKSGCLCLSLCDSPSVVEHFPTAVLLKRMIDMKNTLRSEQEKRGWVERTSGRVCVIHTYFDY